MPPLTRPVTRPGSSTFHATASTQSNGIQSRPVRDHELLRISWKQEGRRGGRTSEPLDSGEDRKTIERPPYVRSSFHYKFSPSHPLKYYSVMAQSIIYPMWIFGWWLVPLNHRKTSRMRVETTMRAHSRPRGERWLAVSQAENLFPVRRNLIYVWRFCLFRPRLASFP